jgi:hypothetical protein
MYGYVATTLISALANPNVNKINKNAKTLIFKPPF